MKSSILAGVCVVVAAFVSVPASADETPVAKQPTALDAVLKRPAAIANLGDGNAQQPESVRVAASGGPIDGKPKSLAASGGTTAAQAGVGAGRVPTVDAPKAAEPAAVRQSARRRRVATANAEDPQRAVIESLNKSFALCLTAADGTVEGVAVLNASISQSGDVTASSVVTPGGVSPKAAACFNDVVAHAKFAPSADASVVQVRVVPREIRGIVATWGAVASK